MWLDAQSNGTTWRSGNFTMGPGGIDEELIGRVNLLQLYTQVQNDAHNSIIPLLATCFFISSDTYCSMSTPLGVRVREYLTSCH